MENFIWKLTEPLLWGNDTAMIIAEAADVNLAELELVLEQDCWDSRE